MDGIACEAGVVVVSKNKIWLDGCGGRLAEMKPADTSFTSKHLGGDSGIAGHGQLGLVDQQIDIAYTRARDVTQNITQKQEIGFKAPKRRF